MVKKTIFFLLLSSSCVHATEQAPKALAAVFKTHATKKIRGSLTQQELDEKESWGKDKNGNKQYGWVIPEILYETAHDPEHNHLLEQYLAASPSHYTASKGMECAHFEFDLMSLYLRKFNKPAVALLVKAHLAALPTKTVYAFSDMNDRSDALSSMYSRIQHLFHECRFADAYFHIKDVSTNIADIVQCKNMIPVLLPGAALDHALLEICKQHTASKKTQSSDEPVTIYGDKLAQQALKHETELRAKVEQSIRDEVADTQRVIRIQRRKCIQKILRKTASDREPVLVQRYTKILAGLKDL